MKNFNSQRSKTDRFKEIVKDKIYLLNTSEGCEVWEHNTCGTAGKTVRVGKNLKYDRKFFSYTGIKDFLTPHGVYVKVWYAPEGKPFVVALYDSPFMMIANVYKISIFETEQEAEAYIVELTRKKKSAEEEKIENEEGVENEQHAV